MRLPRVRFSVRGLMVVVAVVALSISAVQMGRHRRSRLAEVAALQDRLDNHFRYFRARAEEDLRDLEAVNIQDLVKNEKFWPSEEAARDDIMLSVHQKRRHMAWYDKTIARCQRDIDLWQRLADRPWVPLPADIWMTLYLEDAFPPDDPDETTSPD